MDYPTHYPLLLFVLSFIGLWLSAWAGWWFRRRQGALDAELREDFGFILAATLTLLGLIIGFSFSMATSRYDQRRTTRRRRPTRSGRVRPGRLAAAADAAAVHALVRKYLDERVLFYMAGDGEELQQINARTARLQTELWSASALGRGAADTHDGPGRFGHERRIEFAGVHPGWVLESNPNRGMGFDGGNRHRL